MHTAADCLRVIAYYTAAVLSVAAPTLAIAATAIWWTGA